MQDMMPSTICVRLLEIFDKVLGDRISVRNRTTFGDGDRSFDKFRWRPSKSVCTIRGSKYQNRASIWSWRDFIRHSTGLLSAQCSASCTSCITNGNTPGVRMGCHTFQERLPRIDSARAQSMRLAIDESCRRCVLLSIGGAAAPVQPHHSDCPASHGTSRLPVFFI